MFLDRKISCSDVSSSQLYLHIQHNPNQNPSKVFLVIGKLILQLTWTGKRLRIGKTILKEKNKIRGLALCYFKTFYKATISETVHWLKNRQTNGTEQIVQI